MAPKLVPLRRSPNAWNALRVVVALASVSLIVGAAIGMRFAAFAGVGSILGAVVLLLAVIALGPERTRLSLDDRMRELGALVVVNGGQIRSERKGSIPAHLFVGADRLWVLDKALAVLFETPLASLSGARAEAIGEDWQFSLRSRETGAELVYTGPFAEHFARVAESTVRSQLYRELPVLP